MTSCSVARVEVLKSSSTPAIVLSATDHGPAAFTTTDARQLGAVVQPDAADPVVVTHDVDHRGAPAEGGSEVLGGVGQVVRSQRRIVDEAGVGLHEAADLAGRVVPEVLVLDAAGGAEARRVERGVPLAGSASASTVS